MVQPRQVPSQEDLAVLNRGTAILRPDGRILVVSAIAGGKYASGDVVLQQLAVYGVDNVGDDEANEVLATLERGEITWQL